MIQLEDGTLLAKEQYNLIKPCVTTTPKQFRSSHDYDDFMLCGLTMTFHDNLFFYKIPTNFVVYSRFKSTPIDKMVVYINSLDTGQPVSYEYKFIHAVELVAMDMRSNQDVVLSYALSQGRDDIVDAIKTQNMPILVVYLQSLGFIGVITDTPRKIYLTNAIKHIKNM